MVRLDRHGDPLPEGALARLGTVRLRTGGTVRGLALSPDGTRVAAVSADRVYVWDRVTGALLPSSLGLRPGLSACADIGLPEAHTLVYACGGGGALRGRIDGPAPLREFPLREGWPGALATAAGRLATLRPDGRVAIWDLAADTQVLLDGRFPDRPPALALSADGRRVAAACDDQPVTVWDTEDGRLLHTFERTGGCSRVAALSADGSVLATSDRGHRITLYDLAGSGVAAPHPLPVTSLLLGLRFAPGGRVLAVLTSRGELQLWDTTRDALIHAREVGHLGWTGAIDIARDGTLAYGVSGAVLLLDAFTGRDLPAPAGHGAHVLAVALPGEGRSALSIAAEPCVRYWDAITGEPLRVAPTRTFTAAAVSADGTVLAFGEHPDRTSAPTDLVLRDGVTAEPLPDREVAGVGRVLVSANGRVVVVGAVQRGLLRIDRNDPTVTRLADTSHGLLAVSATAARVATAVRPVHQPAWCLLAVRDGATAQVLWERRAKVTEGLALSPDGSVLATWEGGAFVRLWDGGTGEPGARLRCPARVTAAVFAPDGQALVVGTEDGRVARHDLAGNGPVVIWKGHLGAVTVLGFSADGARLASGSADTTVLVWDVSTLPQPDRDRARVAGARGVPPPEVCE